MLDTMAQRYGCLPSSILARGDTLDINIMTRAISWHNERHARSERGQAMPSNFGYDTKQLQSMLDGVRNDVKSR